MHLWHVLLTHTFTHSLRVSVRMNSRETRHKKKIRKNYAPTRWLICLCQHLQRRDIFSVCQSHAARQQRVVRLNGSEMGMNKIGCWCCCCCRWSRTRAIVPCWRSSYTHGFDSIYVPKCNEMSIGFNSWLNYCIICWMSADNNSFARWLPLVTHSVHGWVFFFHLFLPVDNESARWHNDDGKQFKMQPKRKEKSKTFFAHALSLLLYSSRSLGGGRRRFY